MKNAYVPVVSQTFVNARERRVRTLRLALHNRPVLTQIGGRLGGRVKVNKFEAQSREEARERFEAKVEKLVESGYVQVA